MSELDTKKAHTHSLLKWENSNNIQYYDMLHPQELQEIAVKGGLDNCCDVALIKDYIATAQSILEVGAGYGRVLRALLSMGYLGKLYGLERNNYFYHLLCAEFTNATHIIQDDIRFFHTSEKFDLILWMWASISEFSSAEQYEVLKKQYDFLNQNGHLIVDVIHVASQFINAGVQISDQQLLIVSKSGTPDHCYMPSEQEMYTYAERLSAKLNKLPYLTSTGRARVLYVFSKE